MSKTTSELTLTIVLGAFLVVSSGMRADSGQGPGEGWDDAQLLMIDEIQRDAIAIAIAIAAPLAVSEKAKVDFAELRAQTANRDKALQRARNCLRFGCATGLISAAALPLIEQAPVIGEQTISIKDVSAPASLTVDRPGARG